MNLLSNNRTVLSEGLFRTSLNLVLNNLGNRYLFLLPVIAATFNFILFNNVLGLIAYSFSPTVELVMTLSLAITVMIGILIRGFMLHGAKLFCVFLPEGIPSGLLPLIVGLEVISFIMRTFSLGVRLAVNLITGKILAKVIVGFIYNGSDLMLLALPLLSLFLGLEILIAYLQSYIFTFIFIVTVKDLDL